mmetsp:Transcript_26068/g.44436  ORF Transcript_26068/g.44436 Transcript_26068/m.44436 type:complete len:187 (+) Transcript_26068:80-640(+)
MVMEDAWAAIDHIATRVTASAATGLGCGAAYATYKGFPIFKTSVQAAVSCAMVSTACFGMERLAHGIMSQSAIFMNNDEKPIIKPPHENPNEHNGETSTTTSSLPSPILQSTTSSQPLQHYGSHALGGMFGGGVVGFLFQGKPLAGAFLLTPLMLGIGKIEASLDEYRTKRLQQLLEDHDQGRKGT